MSGRAAWEQGAYKKWPKLGLPTLVEVGIQRWIQRPTRSRDVLQGGRGEKFGLVLGSSGMSPLRVRKG